MDDAPTRPCGDLLLVDDDALFARVLARALTARGFRVATASSVQEALAHMADGRFRPSCAVVDLNLGGESGLQLVPVLRQSSPTCRVVILTGYASIATAVEAIKLGAHEYLAKPADVDAIIARLTNDRNPIAGIAPTSVLSVSQLEWEHIQRTLADHAGNISATARALKMHRRTLQRKLGKRAQPTVDRDSPGT